VVVRAHHINADNFSSPNPASAAGPPRLEQSPRLTRPTRNGILSRIQWELAMARIATVFVLVALSSAGLTAGCATHRLVVAQPNPSGEATTVNSNAFGFGAVQRRTVADCPSNLIDEVRVKQNIGQALATVLTLGLWQPMVIEYRCAKVPSGGAGVIEG